MQIHRVKRGQTLYSIAREYGLSPKKLAEINGIKNPDKITVGRELLILFPKRTYTARRGDTLDGISRRFSLEKDEVFKSNPTLCGQDKIYPEEILCLGYCDRGGSAALAEGYIYNGCPRERLALTMPYLSSVCPSSLVYERGRLRPIFNFNARDIRCPEKKVNQRIYSGTPHSEGELCERTADIFINAAIDAGATGITLAMPRAVKESGFEAFLSYMKNAAKEKNMTLSLESSGEIPEAVGKIPDRLIITDSGEATRNLYNSLCEGFGASKIMMDISPFATLGGEPIPIDEALMLADEKGIPLELSDEGELTGIYREKELVLPSMKKTKAKLDLIGELGLLGAIIDVMRCPMSTLMMLSSLYDLNPSYFSGGI